MYVLDTLQYAPVCQCVTTIDLMYRIKPEELYFIRYEKGSGRRSRPFSQLRMENSECFNRPKTHPNIMMIPHNQQLGNTR